MFLSDTTILEKMAVLQTGFHRNRDGRTVRGKLWLIGENVCTLTGVELRTAKTGQHFILVELKKKPIHVQGLKTKVTFVPHTEVIFVDRMKEFLWAFRHELKDKPPDMEINTYIRHIKRRVDTFIGREIKVAVRLSKELRRDEYGQAVTWNRFHDDVRDVYDYRMNIDMFYNINDTFDFDYRTQSLIFAE